ncbi:MAG: hypothetical protein PHH49_05705 [Candidatus Omnitrophica bacterium]|nr:hypothetical protein [Candidatus Omnitrophota bacterium]MDD5488438.1 hypothetical protein [Candidatus Omnitrophota bacterium]
MPRAGNKRKKYIILLNFQLKYIIYILLFLYIGAAVAGYTVYYTTWTTLGEKLANVYPRGRLFYIFRDANITLLFRILLITPLFVILGVFISHRIAGPIYRIGKYLDQLIGGDYSRGLVLRRKDELKMLAFKLSKLRDKLLEQREKRNRVVEHVAKMLEGDIPDNDTLKEVREKLLELREG